MTSLDKKIVSKFIGMGGWNCPCCAPPPGKYRRKIQQIARKIADRFIVQESIGEYYEEIEDEQEEDSQSYSTQEQAVNT